MQEKLLEKKVYFEDSSEQIQNTSTEANAAQEGHIHAEDIAHKTAAAYFGKEVLSWLEIPGKVQMIAPTEHVKLGIRHTYEDFNFIMQDGTWYHFEFESDKVTKTDLRRFREYEATTSKVHNVDVVTYIICSDEGQKLIEELETGISTYRVKMIWLKDYCVDAVFAALQEKEERFVESGDLIPVALSPLLGGTKSMKERVMDAFQILKKKYPAIDRENMQCLQAILYVLSAKFLNKEDMEEVKEIINMTYLGQLIYNDGYKDGNEQGYERGHELGVKLGREQEKERCILVTIQDNLESGTAKDVIFFKLKKHFALEKESAEVYWEKAQRQEIK